MQLQIECNEILHQQKFCWMCDQLFEPKEAKIIVCNNQGNCYGEVCPECLEKGFNRPKYVLEGDICGCFDNISHETLLEKTQAPPSIRQILNG